MKDTNMKAAVYTKYGPPKVVAVAEVLKPVPRDHEVLIRIYATTVSTGDWRARSLTLPPGLDFGASRVRRFWSAQTDPRNGARGRSRSRLAAV